MGISHCLDRGNYIRLLNVLLSTSSGPHFEMDRKLLIRGVSYVFSVILAVLFYIHNIIYWIAVYQSKYKCIWLFLVNVTSIISIYPLDNSTTIQNTKM